MMQLASCKMLKTTTNQLNLLWIIYNYKEEKNISEMINIILI